MRKGPKKKKKKKQKSTKREEKKNTEPQSRVSGKITLRVEKAEPNTDWEEVGDPQGQGMGHARSEGDRRVPKAKDPSLQAW